MLLDCTENKFWCLVENRGSHLNIWSSFNVSYCLIIKLLMFWCWCMQPICAALRMRWYLAYMLVHDYFKVQIYIPKRYHVHSWAWSGLQTWWSETISSRIACVICISFWSISIFEFESDEQSLSTHIPDFKIWGIALFGCPYIYVKLCVLV